MAVGGMARRRRAAGRADRRAGPVREPTLRPARWPSAPRAGALLRWALVAVLLALAAGVLYAREPDGECAEPTVAVPGAPGPTDEGATRPALPAGLVGVPVRLAEPAALAVLTPGARVDLLATPPDAAGHPTLLADRALVLDVIGAGDADTAPAAYLALTPQQARQAVGMPAETRFAVIVR